MPLAENTYPLQFLGRDEDIPRGIRFYRNMKAGEVAYLLNSGEVVGTSAMQSMYCFIPKDEALPTHLWSFDGEVGDYPSAGIASTPTKAIELIKKWSRNKGAEGPSTLRGSWAGTIEFRGPDKAPRITLTRKIAAYGVMTVTSAGEGWVPSFSRSKKWFGTERDVSGDASRTLLHAIQAAMGLATGLVAEACTFRDTKRRQGADPAYAEAHPQRRAKDPARQSTERIAERGGAKPARSKPAPKAKVGKSTVYVVRNLASDVSLLTGPFKTLDEAKKSARTLVAEYKSDGVSVELVVEKHKMEGDTIVEATKVATFKPKAKASKPAPKVKPAPAPEPVPEPVAAKPSKPASGKKKTQAEKDAILDAAMAKMMAAAIQQVPA